MKQLKINIPSADSWEIYNVFKTIVDWQSKNGAAVGETSGSLKNGQVWKARWEEVPVLNELLPGNLGHLLGELKVMTSPWLPDDAVVVSDNVANQIRAIASKETA